MTDREAFEVFITAPPFEMQIERLDDRCVHGRASYTHHDVDLEWRGMESRHGNKKDDEISASKAKRDVQLAIYDEVIDNGKSQVDELAAALKGVIRVADRKMTNRMPPAQPSPRRKEKAHDHDHHPH